MAEVLKSHGGHFVNHLHGLDHLQSGRVARAWPSPTPVLRPTPQNRHSRKMVLPRTLTRSGASWRRVGTAGRKRGRQLARQTQP